MNHMLLGKGQSSKYFSTCGSEGSVTATRLLRY
ncbi:hypothetical protein LEMLEM_LOCUS24076, partial [Lemmus lemmus]